MKKAPDNSYLLGGKFLLLCIVATVQIIISYNSNTYAQEWGENAKLVASDADFDDQFGYSVAMGCEYIAVGALNDNDAGGNSGSVYVFEYEGDTWVELTKLTAFDAEAGDRFGFSVAVGHDIVVVGSKGDDDAGPGSGSVYLYDIVADAVVGETKLTAADAAGGDNFGHAVVIEDDRIIIGAPGVEDLGMNSGAVYVFERTGGVWAQTAKILASDGEADDLFGESVSYDNERIVVGARKEDSSGDDAGAAYVYELVGGTWVEVVKLTASDGIEEDLFGSSVSINESFLAVGATGVDDAGLSSGAVYMFEEVGGAWVEIDKLTSSDADTGGFLGKSVSLSGDRAVFGSYGDDAGGALSGAAYIFENTGGVWTEVLKLTASDIDADDLYGEALTIHDNQIVIGARYNDDSGFNSGSAYVYGDYVPVSVTANASPIEVCLGEELVLTGAGADTYVWEDDVVDGESFVPNALGEYTYSVEGTVDHTGCKDEDTIVVTVHEVPNVMAGSSSEILCEGENVTLEGSGTADLYVWDNDVIDGIPFLPPEGTTTYTVVGANFPSGCKDSATIDITVNNVPPPLADFDFTPEFLDIENTEVSFINLSMHADSYTWNFGYGSPTSSEFSPVHNFPEEGNITYWVKLTAMNDMGCESTISKPVKIEDILYYFIPNAFTPDGDSFNDSFKPVFASGLDIYDYHLMIFNRWGEMVFESYDVEYGWTGTYGDLGLVEDGVYIWRVDFGENMSDKQHHNIGQVTVLR